MQTDEQVNVEAAMWEKSVGWILRELAGDRQVKVPNADAMEKRTTHSPKYSHSCSWYDHPTQMYH